MNVADYLRAKAHVLIFAVIGIAVACTIAAVCGCPVDAVVLIAITSVVCAVAACAVGYARDRRFYREIQELANGLEHPYQLHSLMSEPTSCWA